MKSLDRGSDDGNVVIEFVLAVSLFGSVLFPAVNSVASIAAAYRIAENSIAVVARTWTVTEASMRSTVITNLRSELVRNSSMPLRLSVTCTPSCSAALATVVVTGWVDTGVIGEVQSVYRLERDRYGQ